MIDTNKLKGIIAERGKSQRQVAQSIGVSSNTFYSKMKSGIFGSDEIEAMVILLNIDDPGHIFFADGGTYVVPYEGGDK